MDGTFRCEAQNTCALLISNGKPMDSRRASLGWSEAASEQRRWIMTANRLDAELIIILKISAFFSHFVYRMNVHDPPYHWERWFPSSIKIKNSIRRDAERRNFFPAFGKREERFFHDINWFVFSSEMFNWSKSLQKPKINFLWNAN